MKSFQQKDKIALTKTFAAISANLSAGYLGLILIAPNFLPFKGTKEIVILTYDLILSIVFLWVTTKLERRLL